MIPTARSIQVVAVALVVVLAGCGSLGPLGDGGDATASDAPTDAGTDTPATEPPTEETEATPETPSTPTATPTAEPTPTPDPDTGLVIVEVNAEGSGNDEYVVFKNAGELPLDLSGWSVQDEDGNTYRFPDGVKLGIGESVKLYSGKGTQSEDERYWWADGEVWDDGGETVYVFDERGQKVYEFTYS